MSLEILIVAGKRLLELLKIPFIDSEVTFTVVPLIIAMIIMFLYFRKYKWEELGWNSAVANSLVTLFVSIELLKHIYFINGFGDIANYTTYLSRTLFTLILFFLGFILLMINIQHTLPKRIAYYLSSPSNINLISYILILFVHSKIPYDIITFIVIIILFLILRLLLILLQLPVEKMFLYLEEMKIKEKIAEIKNAEKFVKEGKKELKLKKNKG